MEDTLEAARAAVRTPRLVLLVDGYNVSLREWPDRPLEEQRQRLVAGLERLAATTGAEVRVVFDGSGSDSRLVAGRPRGGVQVEFTAAGVEADDVLVGRVESLPLDRPVAVVTDDRRVQWAARSGGAAVLTTAQLVHLLRT